MNRYAYEPSRGPGDPDSHGYPGDTDDSDPGDEAPAVPDPNPF